MKQIPILSGKAMIVEMPEGATNHHIHKKKVGSRLRYTLSNGINTSIELPQGNWRIIGMLSEVTEEQAASIAEEVRVTNQRTRGFKTYTSDIYGNEGYFESAIKSLESSIEAGGYYLDENPIDYPNQLDPKFYDEPYDGTGFYQEIYSSAIEDWQASQSRVLDRSRCLLLGRDI